MRKSIASCVPAIASIAMFAGCLDVDADLAAVERPLATDVTAPASCPNGITLNNGGSATYSTVFTRVTGEPILSPCDGVLVDDAIAAAKEVAKQQAVQACHDAVANDWYWQGLRCQHGEPDVSYSCAEATVGLVLAVPLDPLHIPPEWASFCKITVTAESRAVMRMSCSDGSCPVAPSHDERPPQPGDDDNDAE